MTRTVRLTFDRTGSWWSGWLRPRFLGPNAQPKGVFASIHDVMDHAWCGLSTSSGHEAMAFGVMVFRGEAGNSDLRGSDLRGTLGGHDLQPPKRKPSKLGIPTAKLRELRAIAYTSMRGSSEDAAGGYLYQPKVLFQWLILGYRRAMRCYRDWTKAQIEKAYCRLSAMLGLTGDSYVGRPVHLTFGRDCCQVDLEHGCAEPPAPTCAEPLPGYTYTKQTAGHFEWVPAPGQTLFGFPFWNFDAPVQEKIPPLRACDLWLPTFDYQNFSEDYPFMDYFDNKAVLLTGGTGSYGQAMTRHLLTTNVGKVIVFSRDELKQHEMAAKFSDDRLRFFLGDVRDSARLHRAFAGVDVVLHAAALKQVGACEYNPLEAVKTNVNGTAAVVDAAIDCGVDACLFLSSDKACAPTNVYGVSKSMAEKLVVAANAYSGRSGTRFAAMRYGNVANSRGSVIPIWRDARWHGQPLRLTDDRMTRFWFDLPSAVRFTSNVLEAMQVRVGTLYVPPLRGFKLTDLAQAIGGDVEITGIRPGEKLHEVMVSKDEASSFANEGWALVKDGLGEKLGDEDYASSRLEGRLSVSELKIALEGVPA